MSKLDFYRYHEWLEWRTHAQQEIEKTAIRGGNSDINYTIPLQWNMGVEHIKNLHLILIYSNLDIVVLPCVCEISHTEF